MAEDEGLCHVAKICVFCTQNGLLLLLGELCRGLLMILRLSRYRLLLGQLLCRELSLVWALMWCELLLLLLITRLLRKLQLVLLLLRKV